MQVVIIMGSKSDLEHASRIASQLGLWGIPYEKHIASAHSRAL
jgi:phosphoribosylcarboxyaminoimidazole (NCAIR) mutase